ncbi:MAG: hypothetical protein IJN34_08830 [Clostridia bacterium]|nr:hypothetical protein [Clostridia bacterium]
MNDLKFSVGYPCRPTGSFFDAIAPYLDRIGELYFARSAFVTGREMVEDDQALQEDQLQKFAAQGIRLNLLLNGNCYGGEALSLALAERACKTVEALRAQFGLQAITTGSPFIAHHIKTRFPGMEVRASVNMWIDGIGGMEQCADLFDSFYLKRDYNYCLDELRAQRDWCHTNGKKLYLLANSGCIPGCAYHIFHDNFIAHSQALKNIPQDLAFEPYACRRMLKAKENRYLLLAGNLVRPEDISRYEGLVDGIKLATRIHPFPAIVIGAYKRGCWAGDLSALTEPGFGDLLAPRILENSAIPLEYWTRKTACLRAKNKGSTADCRACGYCDSVLQTALRSYR